jgi:glycosyltransferase involved in cell wall biosynthesis
MGVDTMSFTPIALEEREPWIVFTGSLIPRKGVRYLIEALPDVLRACPEYRLAILGDGPDESDLRGLAETLGIADRVVFAGFLPQGEVKAWLQRARLFVLPSVEEGLGVVLLEAMACGTPVVASRVDGIPEAVTEQEGRLVPPAEPAALAEAIIDILSGGEWQAMSLAARQRAVKHFDWSHIAKRYVELYRRVAG